MFLCFRFVFEKNILEKRFGTDINCLLDDGLPFVQAIVYLIVQGAVKILKRLQARKLSNFETPTSDF